MLKTILKTNGAQQLSKNELQTINGGGKVNGQFCQVGPFAVHCFPGFCCTSTGCAQAGSPECI